MITQLPPYDFLAKCPKCGHKDVHTGYCASGRPAMICWLIVDDEHLHRYCQRCHYEWLEACLDPTAVQSVAAEYEKENLAQWILEAEQGRAEIKALIEHIKDVRPDPDTMGRLR